MVDDVLINFLNHNFKRLIFISATVVMEIKIQKLHVLFKVAFVHLSDVFSGDPHFSHSFVPKQVDHIDRTVSSDDIIHVNSESFLCHFRVPSQLNIFHDTLLFPKDRNRPSYLNMG